MAKNQSVKKNKKAKIARWQLNGEFSVLEEAKRIAISPTARLRADAALRGRATKNSPAQGVGLGG